MKSEDYNSDIDINFYKTDEWLRTCIEGILFVSEIPVGPGEISEVLEITEKKAEEILDMLEEEYKNSSRGFTVRKIAGKYRFYSNPSINDILRNFIKSNIRNYLSQAALETLAIVSYKQPVTRTQIAEIRGVRTDSVVITLVEKGLIKEAGKLKEPGNPIIYKTTDKFLEILGLSSLKDLPPLHEFKEENIEG
ncbi:MAG: SMC-Scp complex subunit ScpB [Actinobacteria bacterium]|nr:SMC-Scp complex subunit ScpB [Actinomycetota bacterium]